MTAAHTSALGALRAGATAMRGGMQLASSRAGGATHRLARALRGAPAPPTIELRRVSVEGTPVDDYWTGHTVNSTPFRSPRQSRRYLEWRFAEYPLFRELMGL